VNSESAVERVIIEDRARAADYRMEMKRDVREGLTCPQKVLPPKYFYDERGSKLFEDICELPEYYQTRTEKAMLERIAPELIRRHPLPSLVEYGSGNSSKTRVILDAMRDAGVLKRYIPIDVSREILTSTAESLVREYSELEVHGVIGDFNAGLPPVANELPSLVIFLGGTIGNLRLREAIPFLRTTAETMTGGDLFLLGVDLVKDPQVLNAAYNDSAGVTAEFNLNVLRVINRELEGEFDLAKFTHYAFYNPYETRIEMHLYSTEDQTVRIGALDLEVRFEQGETILTEISRKFTRPSVESMLNESGMTLLEWYTDDREQFALALAAKAMRGDTLTENGIDP
jgi:L-histidine N-alpha-methyltransferase